MVSAEHFILARKIVYRIYITSKNRFSIIGINDPKSDLAIQYDEKLFATKKIYETLEDAIKDLKEIYLKCSPHERETRFAPDMLELIHRI